MSGVTTPLYTAATLRQAVKRARREALEEAIHIARNRIALFRGREIPEDIEKLLEESQ